MNQRSAPPTTERFPDNLEIGEWKVAKGKAISKSIIEECPFLGGISGVHTWKNLNVEQKVSKYDWIRVKRNTSNLDDMLSEKLSYFVNQQRNTTPLYIVGDSVAKDLYASVACQIFRLLKSSLQSYTHTSIVGREEASIEIEESIVFTTRLSSIKIRFFRLNYLFGHKNVPMTRYNFAEIVNASVLNCSDSVSNASMVVHIGLWYTHGKLGEDFLSNYGDDLRRAMDEVNRASPKNTISVVWLSSIATHFYQKEWQLATRCSQSMTEGPLPLNWSAIRDLEADIQLNYGKILS